MESEQDRKTKAYLTHEMRAPLKALQYALEILEGDLHKGDTERNKARLSAALITAARLNELVDDLLDLSRIQSGRMPMEVVRTDPGMLACETANCMQSWAEKAGVCLTVKFDKQLPEVNADMQRTIQVLTNLISNALKFTPKGGRIEVAVRAGTRDDAGAIVFSVADTGKGIAPQDRGMVFRYFQQAGTAQDKAKGSGLGLPLSRSLVELQGGRMWVEGEEGKGSTFLFTLPAALPAKPAKPASRAAASEQASEA
jgi:signal transduction histidine kinase